MNPQETTERTRFARSAADIVLPRLEPILRLQFEEERDAELAGDLDRCTAAAIAESPPSAASPAVPAADVPYFDVPALRELAARARRFAETLSPIYRLIMIEKAQRLEREAAQQEAGLRNGRHDG
ncbi:MAG: hypothetical protein J0J01_14250 [Reyranella sp.]|uniref:hypothetical protein n=1 Tax=Reyranella sp. TaxID=1929291 RepID=UPI001AD51118|nr:hypothetical protein [Reyranella sp.]MBN9088067.1 hypothetical protein [Reyranella sp.]